MRPVPRPIIEWSGEPSMRIGSRERRWAIIASVRNRPRRNGRCLRSGTALARPPHRPESLALRSDPRSAQLQRFKNEARAAAQLHHQTSSRCYAVGSERGVHFYAMQYIEGQSLAEVIQDLRRAEQQKTKRRMREKNDLLILQSAHRTPHRQALSPAAWGKHQLPIRCVRRPPLAARRDRRHRFFRQQFRFLSHRRPAGDSSRRGAGTRSRLWRRSPRHQARQFDGGCPRSALDYRFRTCPVPNGCRLTQSGDLLGTLRYISPEQAGGQRVAIDHRTDIYSLGATLYELLTLRPPFEGSHRQTLLHQILNDEPRPPRAYKKSIPVELETIGLKAVAKAPTSATATARESGRRSLPIPAGQANWLRRTTAVQRMANGRDDILHRLGDGHPLSAYGRWFAG